MKDPTDLFGGGADKKPGVAGRCAAMRGGDDKKDDAEGGRSVEETGAFGVGLFGFGRA